MARAKRGNPVVGLGMDHQSKHEKMLSEMHDALYSLGNKIRKPFVASGEKLLPKNLRTAETPEAKAACSHIECLHKSMRSER